MTNFRRVLPALVAVLGSVIVLIWTHQLWRAHLGVPLAYGGDSLGMTMHMVQTMQNGWIWSEPRLGAPFIQHFADFPMPDVLMFFETKVFVLFTDNWFAVLNLLYLFTYPCIALSAWWVGRKLDLSPWTATVIAILYAFLPYHAARFEYHLTLSGYFTVPLGIYLAISVLSGNALFTKRVAGPRLARFATLITLRTIVFAVLISLSGAYYTVFTLLMIGIAVAVRLLAARDWRGLLPGGFLIGLMGLVFIAVNSGTLLYHYENGPNSELGNRPDSDVETYGLKLSQMLLPGMHRIAEWSNFRAHYITDFPVPSEGWSTPLGLIGAAGLLWLLVVAVISPLRALPKGAIAIRHRQFATFTMILFIIGTVGGLSTIISLFLFSQVRGWNRLSIVIGFFALVVVGHGVDALARRFEGTAKTAGRAALPVLLSALLAFGLWDQTNKTWIPPYEQVAADFFPDQKFFGQIEAELPTGASVFALPVMFFPESSRVGDVDTYDLLRPYLSTRDIKWGFGGVNGRIESDWRDRLSADSPSQFLFDLVATDFSGLYVDRDAYTGTNSEQKFTADFEAQFAALLGPDTLMVDPGQDRAFYDLRAYGDKLRASSSAALQKRAAELKYPAFASGFENFYPAEQRGDDVYRWASSAHGEVALSNADDEPLPSIVTFEINAAKGTPNFDIAWPNGTTQRVMAGTAPVVVTRQLTLEPGPSKIRITTDSPPVASADTRDLRFGVQDVQVQASGG